ncbi:YpoC family protein [Planomicrobium sp. CPCC 101110]|uniref:YpoC family protein n=1 Tax=Planomicrobium sp. CPCC 101110 TaxID=2599619 RepID=UPI0011B81F29|nr:hypothetical protein [Planomicrobium sp. CPCC 101110]TWT28343.1 hypothetical protein FQV30_07520 [Planomicrobium sp. CPCC 101110]
MKLSLRLTKELIDPFFSEWENRSPVISELHKQRKQPKNEVEAGILLYRKLLAHCNKPESASNGQALMPVNGEERLAFIESNPGSFAAFRQLDELFKEMKKGIASKRVQLKRAEEKT